MIYEYPEIYETFSCIGSKCPDTCCKGWEVDIDDETFLNYKSVNGKFGDKLRENIKTHNGEYYFPSGIKGRCPFLDSSNLCEIYKNLGEESLCDICTEYPRFYQSYDNYEQVDLSISCVEAGRLLYSTDKMRYILRDDDDYNLHVKDKAEYYRSKVQGIADLLIERNEQIIRLQTNTSESLKKLFLKEEQEIKLLIYKINKLEMINDDWENYIKELLSNIEGLIKYKNEFMMIPEAVSLLGKFAEYLVFRYYIDSEFHDRNIENEILFIRRSVTFMLFMCISRWKKNGRFCMEDMIDLSHSFCREVEHSEENQEYLKK